MLPTKKSSTATFTARAESSTESVSPSKATDEVQTCTSCHRVHSRAKREHLNVTVK
jgi:hypothetical protein